MRGRKFKNRVHFGKRYGVSAWIPPKAQQDAAHERTEGMVSYFVSNCHRDWPRYLDDLETLARSCYLQGAMDTAEVVAKLSVRPESQLSSGVRLGPTMPNLPSQD